MQCEWNRVGALWWWWWWWNAEISRVGKVSIVFRIFMLEIYHYGMVRLYMYHFMSVIQVGLGVVIGRNDAEYTV